MDSSTQPAAWQLGLGTALPAVLVELPGTNVATYVFGTERCQLEYLHDGKQNSKAFNEVPK